LRITPPLPPTLQRGAPTQWPPLEGPQCLHPVDAETWNWPLRQYREAYTVADVSAPPDR